MNFISIYLLFWIYSFLGWCMETTLVSIKNKKFINRGFLLGPYCPIYGTGGVILLSLNGYRNDPFVIFILSIFICSLVEYLTSYFMELIYRVRWWDYSNRMFNVNGRICLFNSICFGLLGMLIVCFINPFFIEHIKLSSNIFINIMSIIIFILTSVDMIITFNAMFDIRKTVINIKDKTLTSLFKPNSDSTEEISKRVRSILKDKGFIHKHLSKAYSNLQVYKNNFFKRSEEIIKYRKGEKIENNFIIGSVISIIIGFIIGKILDNISFYIIICFVINTLIIHILNRRSNGK